MKEKIKQSDPGSEYYFTEGCWINELWNSLEDHDVSIARVRVEPGERTALHLLHKTRERYVILQGKGIVNVGDKTPEIVRKNDVVIIPPGTKQSIKNPEENDLIFLAICTPRFVKKNYQEV